MAILGGLAKHRRPLTSFTSSQEMEKGWSYDSRESPILGESLLAVQAGLSQHETARQGGSRPWVTWGVPAMETALIASLWQRREGKGHESPALTMSPEPQSPTLRTKAHQ
ncbi:hypothetical protein KIL84_010143 [Mauremys mutica]|uniref:Uncharacterized protein n=1 Tax=Mauremys mutica TaxID=74926 RepID=A0A9D3XKQ5_9SAUR|nr:hypothetical protein KIL84_010143 [Mauremys mutica]